MAVYQRVQALKHTTPATPSPTPTDAAGKGMISQAEQKTATAQPTGATAQQPAPSGNPSPTPTIADSGSATAGAAPALSPNVDFAHMTAAQLAQVVGGAVASGLAANSSDPTANTKIPLWRDLEDKIAASSAYADKLTKAPVTSDVGFSNAQAATASAKALANTPHTFNQTDAVLQFGSILTDPNRLTQWQNAAVASGLVSIDRKFDPASLFDAWKTAVGWAVAYAYNNRGNPNFKPMTPLEIATAAGQHLGNTINATFTGDKPLGTTTKTDESVPNTAYDALKQALGRNPSQSEIASFQKGWVSAAAAHPVTTTSTGHYVNGVQTGQSDVVSGGFDTTQVADQLIQADPNVAKYQQATTYFNALKDALNAAVPLQNGA